ncbi:oxygen-independent coproporphyrinogen-3 oxidase [Malonomonas rubra DSM 5091]|uniref:Heme chaperone HemW n=1 Tax=Malonomonas rubra DSM 5091 TaxID=1122189 RepID=A0A1M6HAP1_MALRU|nr:radical SAM family heme chaperone HemW [Malonomonas rubra]SHJ19317.1 oxygen-independent coproporphyrinogen-3 oxidase [Malonomonas rubra DSM 5091]
MSSFYLHIPFCQSKCDYCDFYSQPLGSQKELQDYVDLLLLEVDLLAHKWPGRGPLETIFFGGGTPSLLSSQQVGSILRRLEAAFGLAASCEISLEANPGTVDYDKLRGYRQAGVNRLSLGVQTLDDHQLHQLGRIHSASQARQAVTAARQAGFDNLSLDLIFALTNQDLLQLEADVAGLLAMQPEHLALYGLSFEPGTPLQQRLQQGVVSEPDDQFYADSYLLIDRLLNEAGFEHYEISNFARHGYRCQHNQAYWQRRTCLAAGCGAHSFIADGYGERWLNPPSLSNYCRRLKSGGLPLELLETFDRDAAMAEYVYLGLRTASGVCRAEFQQRFGTTVDAVFASALEKNEGCLRLQEDRFRFDLQGWLIYDHLISAFL